MVATKKNRRGLAGSTAVPSLKRKNNTTDYAALPHASASPTVIRIEGGAA